MRAMIFELNRDRIEDGLVAALAGLASGLDQRDGLNIEVHGPGGHLGLPSRVETQLFGIGREALSNVVKHAGASTARVHVGTGPGVVILEIDDDGSGFDPAARHPGHFGLESMRGRAAEIGGILTITSTPGHGTVVRVEVPDEADGVSNGG
jgi:signal transduction histidine kinase